MDDTDTARSDLDGKGATITTRRRVPTIALHDDQLPLVLMGLSDAGKTTQTRLLAQALGVQVTDTDAEVRRHACMTILETFAAEGEESFCDHEHRAMRTVLDSPAATQSVIVPGGGAVLRPGNRDLLRGHTVIYLSASPSTVAKHMENGAGRPVMVPNTDSDQARAAQQRCEEQGEHAGVLTQTGALHAQRLPLYSEVAALTMPTDGLNPQQAAALTLVALEVQTFQTVGALTPMAEAQMNSPTASDGARASPRRVRIQPAATTKGNSGIRRVTVDGQSPYDVLIGYGILVELPRIMQGASGTSAGDVTVIHAKMLSDHARAAEAVLTAEGLRVLRLGVPDGGAAKEARVVEYLWERLGSFRLGRDGFVAGLDGRATMGLTDSTAATWLRDVPVVQAPTTLLAMVDTATGGRTGTDTPAGKNLVGASHPPAVVVADLEVLPILPAVELRTGPGEVIRYDLIVDSVTLGRVLADSADCLTWDLPIPADPVTRSIMVKAAVVGEDLTGAGLQEVLSYEHAYAHAIEKVTDYSWRHGEAVVVGCVLAAEVVHRNSSLDSDALTLHRQSPEVVGLPTRFPEGKGRWEEFKEAMMSDKKVYGGRLYLVLLDDITRPVRAQAPAENTLLSAHEAVVGEAERVEGNHG